MSIDIFIKSYRKDFWLLYYSLRSIVMNVSGYENIVLLIPIEDKDFLDNSKIPSGTIVHYVLEYGNGYMSQQVFKTQAHSYCKSEFILFSDSDCIFHRKVNLKSVIKDNKPEILYTDYSKVEDAIVWKEPTSKFMGEEVLYELMRRNNIVYHRSTIKALNKFNTDLPTYIMNSAVFSEFNAIGAYAMKFEPHKYRFTNTDNWEYSEPLALQCWSYGKPDGNEIERREYERTRSVIKQVFLEDLL